MTSTDIYREVCQAEIEIQAIPSDFSAVARCLRSGKPAQGTAGDSVVAADGLMFRYNYRGHEFPLMLKGVTFRVPRASRVLLVGVNGSGKSTLLRLIAGVKMQTGGSCHVFGRHAFNDTRLPQVVAYLGDWWNNSFFLDESVRTLISNFRGGLFESERCQTIIEMLGVDPEWHINRLSDGQRRRVQILCALVYEKDLFLLDEITTDLDVIVRQNLLTFLKMESQIRGSTIIYATHIFDGLDDWEPTHILQMANGRVANFSPTEDIPEFTRLAKSGHPSPYYALIRTWLVPHLSDLVLKASAEALESSSPGTSEVDSASAHNCSDQGRSATPPTPDPSEDTPRSAEEPFLQLQQGSHTVTTATKKGTIKLLSNIGAGEGKNILWESQGGGSCPNKVLDSALDGRSKNLFLSFEPHMLSVTTDSKALAAHCAGVAQRMGLEDCICHCNESQSAVLVLPPAFGIHSPVVIDGQPVVTPAGLRALVGLAQKQQAASASAVAEVIEALYDLCSVQR